MTENQVAAAVHQLLGLWAKPDMEKDESIALGAGLAPYGWDEFQKAVEALAYQPRAFRPSAQEVLVSLRSVRHREQSRFPALPPAPTVDPVPWFAECRRALADAAKASAAA